MGNEQLCQEIFSLTAVSYTHLDVYKRQSLFLAQKAKKVYGVEIVPQAIDDARENARINGMENVEFFVGKAEEVLPREYEKNQVYADVIVVDPCLLYTSPQGR